MSVRLTSDGAPLAPSSVQVGPHTLHLADGVARGEVPAGTYKLVAHALDHTPRESVVEVERGREVHLDLALQHEQGRLDLTIDPPGALVAIDGVDRGGAPRGLAVDTGTRRLRVRHPGHYDVARPLTIREGHTTAGYVSLPRALAWSPRDTGVQGRDDVLGDADGDGLPELLHRSFATITVVSPWDARELWRAPVASEVAAVAKWVADLDGDAVRDVAILEFLGRDATRLRVWPGAALAGDDPRPAWTRSGRTRGDPWGADASTVFFDVDGDHRDDIVTWSLAPGSVTACSGRTGEVLWQTALTWPLTVLTVDAAAARLHVFSDAGRHALDLRTGAIQWTALDSRPRTRFNRILLGVGDTAGDILVTMTDAVRVTEIELRDGATGALRWTRQQTIGQFNGTIDLGRDGDASRVVIASESDVVALDGKTGAVRWQLPRAGAATIFRHEQDDDAPIVTVARAPGLAAHRLSDGAHLFDVDLGGPAVTVPVRFDWDADGDHELAVAGADGTIAMVAPGGAREGSLFLPDTSPIELYSVGDLDRDGFEDLSIEGAGGPALVVGPKALWTRRAQDAIRATPVVADLDVDGRLEIVAVGIFDGSRGLHVFDAATGALRWPSTHMPGSDILRAPALLPREGGGFDLLVRNSEALHRFDGRTGAQQAALPELELGYASPTLADLDGDGALEALLTPWDANALLAVDPRTLTTLWRLPLPSGGWNPPVVARDRDAGHLVLHLLGGELMVADPTTRAVRWTRPSGQLPVTSPTVADLDGDGALEILLSEIGQPGDLVCLRLSDGAELWRRPGLAGRGSPVVAHDLDGDGAPEILHTGNGTGMFALDRHGATRWRWRPYPARDAQPTADAGGLVHDLDGDGAPEYVSALRDGVVYVLDARTGAFRWQYRTGDRRVEAAPVAADVDGDGRQELVVAGHDRVLHVVRTPVIHHSSSSPGIPRLRPSTQSSR